MRGHQIGEGSFLWTGPILVIKKTESVMIEQQVSCRVLKGPEGSCWVQRVLNNTKGSGRLQMGLEGSRRVKKGPE